MAIFLIITILCVLYSISKSKKSSSTSNVIEQQDISYAHLLQENNTFNMTNEEDDSIIDVTNQSYSINIDVSPLQSPRKVPYWEMQYIYSQAAINQASKEQKSFYYFFKNEFYKESYIDIEDNTNYAFILMFDLLIDYDKHQDVLLLSEQLEKLGEICPKVKPYGRSFLVKKILTKVESSSEEDKIIYNYGDDIYDYNWNLGKKYKEQLNLTTTEVKLLDQIDLPNNNFCALEPCLLAVIKLFIAVVAKTEKLYQQEESTFKKQVELFADIVARKQHNYRNGSYNYNYSIKETKRAVYNHIFKYCENAVRKLYGHKRKLSTTAYYTHKQVIEDYETKILAKINYVIPLVLNQVDLPDEETEIELYAQTTTRWKIRFKELKDTFSGDATLFFEEILKLGALNKKNNSIEHIFFEAANFIAKHDKLVAIKLYFYYVHHDLKSTKINNKQLTKATKKKLFATKEQFQDFEQLLKEFSQHRNLSKTLQQVPEIYILKRKKIKLDSSSIKEVQQQHSGTVELLNEYLQEEEEEPSISTPIQQVILEPTVLTKEVSTTSPFVGNLNFTTIQLATLALFEDNDFSLHEEELVSFAKNKGVFKNQLIESINESCYELLDDILIEEEDGCYTIDTYYFDQITGEC